MTAYSECSGCEGEHHKMKKLISRDIYHVSPSIRAMASAIRICTTRINNYHHLICIADGEQPFWLIDLANDSVSTQHQFTTRRELLNAHGVYELPQIEIPGMPPTLRLLINDTKVNNQTEILCNGENKSIHSTLFITGKCHDLITI